MASSPSNTPGGSHGNEPAPNKTKASEPFSKDEPTSGPAGSSYQTYEAQKEGKPAPQSPPPPAPQPAAKSTPPPTQHAPGSADQRINDIITSGFDARAASRPGRDAYDVVDTAKDLGSKAKHGLQTLSGGQIALGVGVLAAALAFFITKGKGGKYPKVRDQRGGRHQGKPTGHQPHTPRGNDMSHRGEHPRGNTRFDGGTGSFGRSRVQAGSGYGERGSQNRRDQGPGSQRYDPRTGGRQNPNNLS